ncbi:MAG: lysophospholipid acyltransferase family protein [Alphaproteobacteria bacterium]
MTVSPVLQFWRAALLGLNMILVFFVQKPAMWLRLPAADVIPHRWHGISARIFGIKVTRRGEPARGGPLLVVANHVSYLDVLALGSVVNGSFVAKAEIADWPMFGALCRLQNTIFIERNARAALAQRAELESRLGSGDTLILFPEGTSSDGMHMKPFKSTLFSVAGIEVDGRPVPVQPVSIAYVRLDGLPLGRCFRPLYAWYGDMELMSHLWRALGMGRLEVEVTFHPPVTIADFASRKAMSDHCEAVIAAGVANSLAGRPATSAHRPSGSEVVAAKPAAVAS